MDKPRNLVLYLFLQAWLALGERQDVELKIALAMGAAALALSGCERPSAVAERKTEAAAAEQRSTAESYARNDRGERSAPREDEQVRLIDGRPMWSSSRRGTAEENAQRSFERNGEAFDAKDLDTFVRKAHAFIDRPPAGVQKLTRRNGDVLYYDPKQNIFAVANKDGAPRTLFKPDEGQAYWDEQVARESRRQASASKRDDEATS